MPTAHLAQARSRWLAGIAVAGLALAQAQSAAAGRYRVGHGDTGRLLRVTETASAVVETDPATFVFRVVRRSVSRLAPATVRA